VATNCAISLDGSADESPPGLLDRTIATMP
jgi:hypothetical protein